MRTDRRFCGQQCRLWWYRHRGVKRLDFPPGGDRYRCRVKRGQPKTFAQAQAALADARAQVARMEATARQQQTLENQLRNHLMDVSRALMDARAQSSKELDALREELHREHAALQDQHAHLQAETVRVAAEQRAKLEGLRTEADELRKNQSRDAARLASEVRALKAQHDQVTAQHDTLQRQNAELTRSRDEIRGRLEATERNLSQRDSELKQKRENFAAVERAHKEVHVIAESESRSLLAEKKRRLAAEQRVEQLALELERMASDTLHTTGADSQTPLIRLRDDVLAAELKDVRLHRDEAIAERELLSARILALMAPGQYLEHAADARYDPTQDPLIPLKRREVLVEHSLAMWQKKNKKPRRARRLDPKQTLDEQAYAAALSFRWKQVNHPHLRRKQKPKWRAVGFVLDADSERYLMTLTEERIEEMKRKMEQAA